MNNNFIYQIKELFSDHGQSSKDQTYGGSIRYLISLFLITGYSGITCEIAADPCSASPSPCPEASSCQSSVTEYYCQCPMGKPIIGGECRKHLLFCSQCV